MQDPETLTNEPDRLQVLSEYHLLDTPPEAVFDAITARVANLLRVPIALLSLIDEKRQWFKSCYGLAWTEIPRELSLCERVVASGAPLLISDAAADARFAAHPLVADSPGLRSYASVPLCAPGGFVLGTLCALDLVPRALSQEQLSLLTAFAEQAVAQLERKRLALLLQQKDAELKESEARLQALFDGMIDGVAVHDQTGAIISCNPSAERILGLSLEQLRSASEPGWRSLREDGSDFPADELPSRVALRTGLPSRDTRMGVRKPSGEQTWISINAQPMRDERQPHSVIVTFRDITQQLTAERRLSTEQAFLHSVLENIPNSTVAIFNHELMIEQHFGASPLPLSDEPSLLAWSPGQRAYIEEAARRCLRGERSKIELSQAERRLEITLVPFVDANGQITRGLALAYDVSERDKLREHLARQERLVTTGTLAAGVGHEINNPLTYIVGNLEYAQEELRGLAGVSPSTKMKDLLEAMGEARQGAEQIRKIVQGLRAFVRERAPVRLEVRAALEIAINMAMHEVRQKATLKLELKPTPQLLADESGLSQVFVNLLVNAAQAFEHADPSRNDITVRTSTLKDNRVSISICDNGPGIPPEVLPRIFDPFFTTKAIGQGTGLGLSICNSIITSLGGEILCETTLGQGTTFHVNLPAVPLPLNAPEYHQEPPKTKGRVLIIDDDETVLRSLCRLLQAEHEVITASDPREALQRIEDNEAFDVVFCDLMMPHITGFQLYLRVQQSRPLLAERFVFITGGFLQEEARAFLSGISNERLEKPFTSKELRDTARRFIEKK